MSQQPNGSKRSSQPPQLPRANSGRKLLATTRKLVVGAVAVAAAAAAATLRQLLGKPCTRSHALQLRCALTWSLYDPDDLLSSESDPAYIVVRPQQSRTFFWSLVPRLGFLHAGTWPPSNSRCSFSVHVTSLAPGRLASSPPRHRPPRRPPPACLSRLAVHNRKRWRCCQQLGSFERVHVGA